MNLRDVCDLADGLRARGVHPLTPVVIREDSVGSVADVGDMRLDRGRIVISPAHAEVQQPVNVEDDE